ncbi:MAG: hypothetical protein IPM54_19740 [Polyangiaceae bacterium]|nr:hypothetical protein [Polyangiaceae bacterium]
MLWHRFNRVFALAVFVGEILFLLCDCQVAYHVVIGKTPLLQVINNLLYYGGLTALSLSAVFFEERRGEV